SALAGRGSAASGRRVQTGSRVHELVSLRMEDPRLEPPYQVRLQGKGNKVRTCPLWPATVHCLDAYLGRSPARDTRTHGRPLFVNRNGGQFTRFGVRYLLRKYVSATSASVKTLRDKRLHPHSFRHTTALSLLKSGVDFATISQWLGHSALNVTMRYARADLDLKRAALSQVFPD